MASEDNTKRGRGMHEVVALTLRVSRSDWQRLHRLALTEGISLSDLMRSGLSRELSQRGLPGVNSAPANNAGA